MDDDSDEKKLDAMLQGDPALRDRFRALMAKKNALMAKKNAQINALEGEVQKRSLASVKVEFPLLIDTTNSKPYFPINHEHAGIVAVVLRNVSNQKVATVFPHLYRTDFKGKSRNCNHEVEAQQLCVNLLEAVLEGMELDDLFEVVQNRTIAGSECDILLVYKPNRLPVAAIEVKKPGNSSEGRTEVWEGRPLGVKNGGNRVAGEIFDEMKAIQLFGFLNVTGMISTGNQWRIVGLQAPENSIIDMDSVLNEFTNFLKKRKQNPPEEESTADSKPTAGAQDQSPPGKNVILQRKKSAVDGGDTRQIWGGDIVPSHQDLNTKQLQALVKTSGENIITQIVLFVAMACNNLSDLLHRNPNFNTDDIVIRKKMPCRILKHGQEERGAATQDEVFAFGSITLKRLCLERYCEDAKDIYVIHHLGMGNYGNVCLGVSKENDGSSGCCAIKFYHEKAHRHAYAKQECKNWHNVYGRIEGLPMPFVLNVVGGDCLVMPYYLPIKTIEERRTALINDSIKNALLRFAESGYLHTDIQWRHFRSYDHIFSKEKVGLLQRARSSIPKVFQGKKEASVHDYILLVDLGEGSLEDISSDADKETKIDDWVKKSIELLRGKIGPSDATDNASAEVQDSKKKQKTI